MRARLSRLRRDEKGLAFVYVGVGFMSFLAASTLAIDVGMMMTARSQAQNSADAGAMAGAIALVFNSYTNRSSNGPAVQSALSAARQNTVMGSQVSVTSGDVTFPNDASGQPNRVRVTVYRTAARSNAVPTLIGTFFGLRTVNISATATAEASPANAETCVMPFTIPDKWVEHVDGNCNTDGSWSTTSDFNIAKTQGSHVNVGAACSNPDVYVAPGNAGATGYSPAADVGLRLILKNNNQNKVAPSMYNPWDLPGSVGGSDYRDNISGCNTNIVKIGDWMTPENGNMTGPTSQGVSGLLAKDPNAVWDTGCNCVKGSSYAKSPRVTVVPLYDPYVYANGQETGKSGPQLKVANYLGFFIEGMDGSGNVTGRITPVGGLVAGGPGNVPTGAFPKAIRLVQ